MNRRVAGLMRVTGCMQFCQQSTTINVNYQPGGFCQGLCPFFVVPL